MLTGTQQMMDSGRKGTVIYPLNRNVGENMEIQHLAMQIRTTDLDGSIAFYTERLGFTLAFRYEDFYAGVDCGVHRLHLKLVDETDPSIAFVRAGEHLHLHIMIDELASTFQRLQQEGVQVIEAPAKRPWGTTEFVIEDPDGHTIYFAQA